MTPTAPKFQGLSWASHERLFDSCPSQRRMMTSPVAALETPDHRSIGGIDGDLAHFSVASENCQPIDQAA
jgi:hypothetical protein